MARFPDRFIDDLRLQANIVQVIQEFVPLKRSGSKFKGLCPFHSEKTPSFQVDPEKGFFYCFGCHAGGDVFKFLELHEKLDFPESVRLLAQKVGLAIPEDTDESGDRRLDAALRETLLKAHEVAAAYFREQLASPAGARAREELSQRGVMPETIERLGLGYAPQRRDGLKERLEAQGFNPAQLLQSGLVVQRDSSTGPGQEGTVVDRFRHRLIIPICRDSGSVVAFGGRAMDPGQVPKYLNSPETPIYSKGRTLYGLNLTKAAIRTVGFVVLVEGYFDFAQVFQADAAPAVASCGTALTPQQAQLLRRFTSKIVLSFDQDAAGQSAAIRSCELLVSEGFDVNVVVLDKGEDPDTFVRRRGADAYREKLRSSRPYLEYLLDQAAAGLDLGHADQRREFLRQMLTVAARIPDAAARDQFGDRIAHKARITEEVVRAEIRKAAAGRQTTVPARALPTFGPLKDAERGLIWGLFHDTATAMDALGSLEEEDLTSLAGRGIFELARTLKDQGPAQIPSALLQRLSTGDAQLVSGIAASSVPPAPTGECAQAIKRLRWGRDRAAIQREIDRLQELGAGQHAGEIDVLWQRKKELLHRIEE
jgi:DNA primase